MKISVNTVREYIPEWRENKKEDPVNQIVVEHRTPSMSLVEELIPKAALKITGHGDTQEGWETTYVMDTKKIVRGMLLKIRNLTLDIDGKDTPIVSFDDLYNPSAPSILAGLTEELGTYFQKLLSERKVDVKN